MPTNKHLTDLVINKVESQAVYDYLVSQNLINDDELYLVGGESTAVLYTPQTLTNEQKEQARTNIGAISVADIPEVPVTSVAGKTGAVTLTQSDVGLDNVTNESKATMFASPTFTGTPTAPTAANTVDNTQIATTAFVHNVVDALEDKDTTYTAGTALTLNGTEINHDDYVTAGTVQGNSGAVAYGGTITIPTVTYNAQGHITSTGTTTVTLPAKVTAADLGLTQAMKFLGSLDENSAIFDGSTNTDVAIGGNAVTLTAGNVVLYNEYEYVWTGSAWEQLGQEGSFALKSEVYTQTEIDEMVFITIDDIDTICNATIVAATEVTY